MGGEDEARQFGRLFRQIGKDKNGKDHPSGGYQHIGASGTQTLLNYRIAKQAMGCGEVRETPADCMTVSDFLNAEMTTLKATVEGRIVLIGTTDPSYRGEDSWLTPYTRSGSVINQVPGVFLQAQMISQMVSAGFEGRRFLTAWPDWQEMIWIASWTLLGEPSGRVSLIRAGAIGCGYGC